jgi:hypothetical protein
MKSPAKNKRRFSKVGKAFLFTVAFIAQLDKLLH